MKENILHLLETEGDLPPIPDIVIRIHDMVKSIDTNVKDIVKVIEMDPVLAWNILKLSNSVYYSRSTTPVKTLPTAITKIGLNTLMKLVYALKVCPLFTDSTFLSSKDFWTHSLAVALLSQSLSRRLKAPQDNQDISYLAGLMHDVGIMVMGYLIPLEYNAFLGEFDTLDERLSPREQEVFEIDHAEIGALYIQKWWQVDPAISLAVRFHHKPSGTENEQNLSTKLVHAANIMCNSQNITNGIPSKHDEDPDSVLNGIGLSADDMESILEDVTASVEQARELVYSGMAK